MKQTSWTNFLFIFQEKREKGPWLYPIWEEGDRGYGGHIHKWPVTVHAVPIQEIWKEKNVQLFTVWLKNASFPINQASPILYIFIF